MAIAVALILLLVGSVLFHFLSPWYLTPLASNWGSMDGTISITFWVTGFVFAAVTLFMAYAIIRFRHRDDRRAHYEPENKKLELWLTGLTTLGIAALLAPGLLVWAAFVDVPEGTDEVEVVGQQWHWSYRFPGADRQFGKVDARRVSDDNPFGMDRDDPLGQDDVLVDGPKLVLPLDRPVKALLRSKDVLHNFQVAQFRAKMDLVPGQVTYFWLTPTRVGSYEVLCAELCGIAHFAMRGRVEVVEQAAFAEWLARQPTYAAIAARAPGDATAGQAAFQPCAACHGAQGEGNKALNAPRLAGQPAWYLIRQLQQFKDGGRGAHPDDTAGQQMRAFAATLADRGAMADVSAYVATLPDAPQEQTVAGSPARGAPLYRTCAHCHGADGQGIQATNAPPLAGMSDWYLARQLHNFRQGLRGRHPDDLYGWQMAEMSRILADDQAVDNVVAYINTLTPAGRAVADAGAPLAGRSP